MAVKKTIAVAVAPTTYARQPTGGGTPTDVSNPTYGVSNKGTVTGIGSLVTTDLNAVATSGTIASVQLGSIVTQVGSIITAIGSGTGSTAAAALLTLSHTGTTDIATILTDVTSAVTDAATLTTLLATIATDLTTVQTADTALLTNIGSQIASAGSLAAIVATGSGSAQVAALLPMLTTASADAAALVPLMQTAVDDHTAYETSPAAADVVVTFNSTNVTRVQQLQRAFDQIIGMANGGYGGLTK